MNTDFIFIFFLSIKAMGAPLQGSRELVGKCETNSPGDMKKPVQGEDTLLLTLLELRYVHTGPGSRHKHRTGQVGRRATYTWGSKARLGLGFKSKRQKIQVQ